MARYIDRSWRDMSEYAVHFTKAFEGRDAYENMWRIVQEGLLRAGPDAFGAARRVDGARPSQRSACFSEIPLDLLPRLVKRRNSLCGIVFTQAFLLSRGGARVWYVGNGGSVAKALRALIDERRKARDADDPFWALTPFIDFPGDYGGGPYRFEWEREWRVPGGMSFHPSDVSFLLLPEEKHAVARRSSFKALKCPLIDPLWPPELIHGYLPQPSLPVSTSAG
jgi:hypothetical protein